MITPNIRYYAKMVFDTKSKKTPKYKIISQAGFYMPMEQLKGRDGLVSMFLQVSQDSGSAKSNAPSMRLQAKNSLNFTGLKDYFKDGRLSGFAYGYPLGAKVYGKEKKENPFFEYKDDGYLFIIHQDQTATSEADKIKPSCIELVVLEGAKVLISSYCKQLIMGGFDEALKSLREQAKRVDVL